MYSGVRRNPKTLQNLNQATNRGSAEEEMARDKQQSKHTKHAKHNKRSPPLAPNKPKFKKTNKNHNNNNNVEVAVEEATTPSQQLSFFLNHYQSSNKIQLSSLELDSIKGSVFSSTFVFVL